MVKRKAGVLPNNRDVDSTRPFAITDDEWLRRATAGAIAQMRKILAMLPAGTPVSAISEHEMGWVCAAALFGWVSTRGEQAASEGLNFQAAVRTTKLSPDPWDAGAVMAILPRLADIEGVDWSKPLSAWAREEIVTFILAALAFSREAMAARNDEELPSAAEINFDDPHAPNDQFEL